MAFCEAAETAGFLAGFFEAEPADARFFSFSAAFASFSAALASAASFLAAALASFSRSFASFAAAASSFFFLAASSFMRAASASRLTFTTFSSSTAAFFSSPFARTSTRRASALINFCALVRSVRAFLTTLTCSAPKNASGARTSQRQQWLGASSSAATTPFLGATPYALRSATSRILAEIASAAGAPSSAAAHAAVTAASVPARPCTSDANFGASAAGNAPSSGVVEAGASRHARFASGASSWTSLAAATAAASSPRYVSSFAAPSGSRDSAMLWRCGARMRVWCAR
mmetsp:Transcript_28353/g.87912  ORF Transcript_28353/g.87912 Transcript_28353/m.87912 type:complete len:288 (+) Transcript_28353:739-1602(+)